MIGSGCTHEGNDVFSPRLLTVLIFQFSKPRRNSYTLHASFKHGLEPFQATPRWRSGHAVDCRSTILRFKSGPWLSIAATAGVSHPFPFRTRKLRHLTWMPVLRYASPRERTHAAIVQPNSHASKRHIPTGMPVQSGDGSAFLSFLSVTIEP